MRWSSELRIVPHTVSHRKRLHFLLAYASFQASRSHCCTACWDYTLVSANIRRPFWPPGASATSFSNCVVTFLLCACCGRALSTRSGSLTSRFSFAERIISSGSVMSSTRRFCYVSIIVQIWESRRRVVHGKRSRKFMVTEICEDLFLIQHGGRTSQERRESR